MGDEPAAGVGEHGADGGALGGVGGIEDPRVAGRGELNQADGEGRVELARPLSSMALVSTSSPSMGSAAANAANAAGSNPAGVWMVMVCPPWVRV
ncbi:hypothetical protein [Thermocatellispora tengchongensis]|uniref:hypothetical protein n=1 Tax=Thermocatellispora tengchongensis TaxID=1073253 RepID=UPI0036271F40